MARRDEERQSRGTAGRGKGPASRLRTQMEALPRQVKREAWQIHFLTEELRGATTEVERSVILDWLAQAKERRAELETDLERCRVEYQEARGKRGPKRVASPSSESPS